MIITGKGNTMKQEDYDDEFELAFLNHELDSIKRQIKEIKERNKSK